MRKLRLGCAFLLLGSLALEGQIASSLVDNASALTTADGIMARVAENQDRAEAERAHYVYVQHAHIASRKGKRIFCEETTDSRVAPLPTGVHKELLTLDGRMWLKGHYVAYTSLSRKHPGEYHGEGSMDQGNVTIEDTDEPMDRGFVEGLRESLTDDKSKDGFNAGLFPLTSAGQKQYDFVLLGRERTNNRDVFHVSFRPKDETDYNWQGDVYIDSSAYQPVLIRTRLSRNVPFLVRTMLGTSVPGLGFSATFAPQNDGVWFPVTFGTEFKVNAVFLFHRTFTMAVENARFEKTHASGRIVGEAKTIGSQPPE